MANDGIWLIDDDHDDSEVLQEICRDLNLPNTLLHFEGAASFFKKLIEVSESPFMILCDTNLRGMSGFAVRQRLLSSSEKKFHSVPFIFWSETGAESEVYQAFRLRAHGFFVKPADYDEWKHMLKCIVQYWNMCKMPRKVEGHDEPLPY
jgi:DNA-binding NtrC family response regulator